MSSWVVRKFSFVVATGNDFTVVKHNSTHWYVAVRKGKAAKVAAAHKWR